MGYEKLNKIPTDSLAEIINLFIQGGVYGDNLTCESMLALQEAVTRLREYAELNRRSNELLNRGSNEFFDEVVKQAIDKQMGVNVDTHNPLKIEPDFGPNSQGLD